MRVVVITPPEPIVSLEEAKRQLRQDQDDDDDLITALIATAQAGIEPPSYLGCAFGVQTLEMRVDLAIGHRPFAEVEFRYPPVRDLVSVKYDDVLGVEQELGSGSYRLIGAGTDAAVLAFAGSWPSIRSGAEAVRIRYQAGYDADDPQLLPAKQAVLMTVADLYAHRETVAAGMPVSSIPSALTVERLLQRYRVYA